MDDTAPVGSEATRTLRPPHGQSYSIHMNEGVRIAAARLGLSVRVVEGATSDSPSALIKKVLPRYLSGADACDGLIIPAASAAMAAVSAAEDMGLRLGVDLDLAAKEAVPFLRRFRREILAVQEDAGAAGAFLARALMHRIAHPDEPPMQYLDVPVLPVT